MPKTEAEILALLDARIKELDDEAQTISDYESVEDAYAYHITCGALGEAVSIHNLITGGDYWTSAARKDDVP